MRTREQMQARVLFDVAGPASLVTGGPTGIGHALAEVMAANGARVSPALTALWAKSLHGIHRRKSRGWGCSSPRRHRPM